MTLLILSCGSKRLTSSLAVFNKQLHTQRDWCSKRTRHKLKYTLLIGLNCSSIQSERFLSNRPTGRTNKNYYNVLNISSKATQSQVKLAYYELSKKYHPDTYKGKEDAALKFREITEAYEVIGNLQKRRMYDKGILNIDVAATPKEAENYSSKFYEARSKRARMPSSGRTPIFNFDEWSNLHYETNFNRKQATKMRYEELIQRKEDMKKEDQSNAIMYCILFLGMSILFHHTLSNREDKPKPSNSSKT